MNVQSVTQTESDYLESIGDLWARWSVIPIHRGGKRPVVEWAEYQERRPTYDVFERWFAPRQLNIGVVTGRVSGIFVLDADSPEAQHWAQENFPPTELRVRTTRGLHLYYPLSSDSHLRNKTKINVGPLGRLAIDVRAEGGYVVGPGSVHPSGAIYTREGAGWATA